MPSQPEGVPPPAALTVLRADPGCERHSHADIARGPSLHAELGRERPPSGCSVLQPPLPAPPPGMVASMCKLGTLPSPAAAAAAALLAAAVGAVLAASGTPNGSTGKYGCMYEPSPGCWVANILAGCPAGCH